jgi:hypothetical protein
VEIPLATAGNDYEVTVNRPSFPGVYVWSECCCSQVSTDEARRIHAALGAWLEGQA